MVQTASMGGGAAAGFVRGLTLGAVKGEIEYEPIQQAAKDYLATSRGAGCTLSNSRKLTQIGWEWDFECPDTALLTKPPGAGGRLKPR
jgi:hypothetical protein